MKHKTKSELRKKSCRGREKGKTCILTDTTEENRIEEEIIKRKAKKESKLIGGQKSCKRKLGLGKIKQEDFKKIKKCLLRRHMKHPRDEIK